MASQVQSPYHGRQGPSGISAVTLTLLFSFLLCAPLLPVPFLHRPPLFSPNPLPYWSLELAVPSALDSLPRVATGFIRIPLLVPPAQWHLPKIYFLLVSPPLFVTTFFSCHVSLTWPCVFPNHLVEYLTPWRRGLGFTSVCILSDYNHVFRN